jgi:hypothetical protein
MRKNIRNYTSTVAVQKSVNEIQDMLVSRKAKNVMFEYDNGMLVGMVFIIDTSKGSLPIKLPARVKLVERLFYQDKNKGSSYYKKELTDVQKDQAYRTAWKNLRDWVDIQMTLLDLDMVKMEEVFLPYMVTSDGKTTFFEWTENRNFLLPSGS